ncbi:CNP1-like family protein [Hydrogenophaga sp.]|uniref:CNP1-like family protein n=1 Tax=Hydrogenophaga sp. TaxID=1904254 RepID=UPI003F720428
MTTSQSRLPTRKSALARASLCALFSLNAAGLALAVDDEAAWQEMATPAPKTFSVDRLQSFTVSPSSSLTYGIDPETLTVGEDRVVRYVMVARSSSGALNVLYEGIRCQSAQVKTYARWDNNRSAWNTPQKAEWKPLALDGATRPATILAMEGLCNGNAVNGTPRKMLATLKTGRYLQR